MWNFSFESHPFGKFRIEVMKMCRVTLK